MYFLPAVQPVLQAVHFQYGFQKHRLHSNPALKIQKKKIKKKKNKTATLSIKGTQCHKLKNCSGMGIDTRKLCGLSRFFFDNL